MKMAGKSEKIPSQWYNPQQQHQLPLNEKDGFLMWLRGEFAAANAIIDALCHHLRAVGEPGEYDNAVGCIQQRRYSWGPALHMQQYFSVAEVVTALHQVGWRRQQQLRGGSRRIAGAGGQKGHFNGQANGGGGLKGSSAGETNEVGGQKVRLGAEANGNGTENDGKKVIEECNEKVACSPALSENSRTTEIGGSLLSESAQQAKKNREITPKTFIAPEIFDGKSINAAQGMELYEDLVYTDSEVSKLITLVNDLRTAGIKGQLQGQTYAVAKRPMRGHGREIIQLGSPATDSPHEDDESSSSTSKDQKTEPIPDLLMNAIEFLLSKEVLTTKPDTCFIDIYNEGDHSHPHVWPRWYGRPICTLSLTDCDMSFGKVITFDRPGEYRGALKISLSPGSVLVMKGGSADFSRHAIHSLDKKRMIVTFLKSLPRKANPRVPTQWAPPPNLCRPQIFQPTPGIVYHQTTPVLHGTGVFIPPNKMENNVNADDDDDVSGESNDTSHQHFNGKSI